MDKRANHSLRHGPNKTSQSELSRKSLEVSSCKQWPHSARRRENTYQSNSKQEPNRKSSSAKSRPNGEKRPRIRGFGASACGSSATCDMSATSTRLVTDQVVSYVDNCPCASGDLPEFETSSTSSLRKTAMAGTASGFHNSSRKNGAVGAKRHKYNKEQFLQANFQFVLKSAKNIQQNIASPDTLVDWNLIEQINIQTTEEPQCPICLYPPVAAKLTRCGHVYCWPCILHYLALSDKTWRKCPICYDAVHFDDLKSTSIYQLRNWNVYDTITMQLMRRQKGSIFIEHGEHLLKMQVLHTIPHLRDDHDRTKFSKFLLADPNEIQSIIDRERRELQLGKDEDSPESIFANQALDFLQKRENNLKREFATQCVRETNKDLAFGEVKEISRQQSVANLDIIENSEKFGVKDDAKYHYFYQSSDGQHIYLHSLNVRILQAMYGSLIKCPGLIQGKILEKHSYSMDEDIRRKFKYLEHLPLTCQFEVVELELATPVVSPEIFHVFRDEIFSRENARLKRAREDSKRERQINEINERQMGKIIFGLANIDIESSQQFPPCGYGEFQLVNSSSDFPQPLGYDLASSSSTAPKTSISTSFADMLSTSKRESWPTLGNLLTENQSENIDAWGKTNPNIRNHEVPPISGRVLENDDLEKITEDLHQHNLGDAIAQALQQKKTVCDYSVGICTDGNPGSKSKKNRKNKKMLLFSTGMNYKAN